MKMTNVETGNGEMNHPRETNETPRKIVVGKEMTSDEVENVVDDEMMTKEVAMMSLQCPQLIVDRQRAVKTIDGEGDVEKREGEVRTGSEAAVTGNERNRKGTRLRRRQMMIPIPVTIVIAAGENEKSPKRNERNPRVGKKTMLLVEVPLPARS